MKVSRSYLVLFLFLPILIIGFQNCGQSGFNSLNSHVEYQNSAEADSDIPSTIPSQGEAETPVNDVPAGDADEEEVPSTSTFGTRIFNDGFESANLSNTNTSGFRWGGTNYTSVVTMLNSVATVVYNGAVVNKPFPGLEWTAHENQHSLRFRYPAGGSMSEQRFALGQHYSDIYISYWIRVPHNFYHGSGNNKFLAVWTLGYDGAGDVTFQTRPTGSGNAKLVVQDGGVAVPEVDVASNFISVADQGRWMHIVYRFRPATTSGANNGLIQVHRRWANESEYTMLYNKTNSRFSEGGQGIHQGYLMGWANAPYQMDTDWLIDQFEVSQP